MDALNEKVIIRSKTIDKVDNFLSNISYLLHGKNDDNEKEYIKGSVSQYSKNLIMTFPVLCDNSLSPETASMISKANERNITTMLQLLFTAMNIEASDGMKVLSKIHKNISIGMDVAEVADKMEEIGARTLEFGSSGRDIFARESTQLISEMMDELKYKKYNKSYPVNSLSEESLNRFTINKTYDRIIVKEASKDDEEKRKKQAAYDVYRHIRGEYWERRNSGEIIDYYNHLQTPEFAQKIDDIIGILGLDNVAITDKQRAEIEKQVRDMVENDLKTKAQQANIDLNKSKLDTEKTTRDLNKMKSFELYRNNMVAKLVDTDVKKANELQPTIIQVNYSQKNEAGEFELRSFLAGIKSRLIPVSSTDIVERIIAKNKTKINFLNFIRATTGEIKFFKDFLFAIDQAKLDSKNAVKKGEAAAIWNCLSNRAVKNTNSKLKKLGNDASAITVLVLSQETVNYMKSVHKFDLEKMSNTKMVCDVYNLMGIMIADESIEVLKSFYVGNSSYEQIAYSFLEKEAKNSDYKKMINLFGKMNVR